MLFDTHAHYDDEAFDPDRREVLAGLPQKGVGLVVNPGCTLTSSEKAVALAAEFPHVYAAVGLHPENCHDFQPEQIECLRQLARREKVVAIGEVGLDYYWEENPPRALQQEVKRRPLALAEELKLPVMSKWDYTRLQIAPCRQFGSSRTDDLVIAAHNYRNHFGRLKELAVGDSVAFTDMEGIVNTYRVEKVETLQPTEVAAVQNSGHDLVLYTCTKGGKTRVTVFCDRAEEKE